MDLFLKLEFNRLIKELDFIDSDLIYKSTVLKLADENFIKNVNEVLESFPQLKQIVDEKSKKRFEMINNYSEEPVINPVIETEDDEVYESKNPKLKTLYRQIARTTHPDVSSQSNLKEVYLEAQKAYDTNDLIQIFSICEKLKIDYDITNEEFNLIKNEIDLKRQRVRFLESTYTWKWYQVQSLEEKNKIILNYLETQISK
jgi:hypothetical protein